MTLMLELVAAGLLGVTLLWLALDRSPAATSPEADVDADAYEDTEEGRALLAIKDLDFDRETGKIAEPDYQALRERLTVEAAAVLQRAAPPVAAAPDAPSTDPVVVPRAPGASCRRCGPRPEPDAAFCSTCGGKVAPA